MTWTSEHKNQPPKKLMGVALLFPTFPLSWKWSFWPFSQYRAKWQNRQKPCFLFWRFYSVATIWCKNWLLKPLLCMKLFIWKYFSKILVRNFNYLQSFRPAHIKSGPFRAIPSICNQRSLVSVSSVMEFLQTFLCPKNQHNQMRSLYFSSNIEHDVT
jgi:hypothetical protein